MCYRKKDWFLNNLDKSWVSLTEQKAEKQSVTKFCTTLPIKKKYNVTMTKKEAFISNTLQLQNLLEFIFKNKSISATSILCRSSAADNTTASLDKLTCTEYADFGICQDSFGQFFWSKNCSNYLDVKFQKKRQQRFLTGKKILQWDRQNSTSSCGCGISWSLQPRTLVETKTCFQC